jgi:hypothetical protein
MTTADIIEAVKVVALAVIAFMTYLAKRQATAAAVKMQEVAETAATAAVKVEEVKSLLHETTSLQQFKADDIIGKSDAIIEKVEVIHKATNSLVQKRVDEAKELGEATGALEERARADAVEQRRQDQL